MSGSDKKIKLTASDRWQYDRDSGQVMYNPKDFPYMTPREIVGMLMHEVGHIRYSKDKNELKALNPYNQKWPDATNAVWI